MQPSIVVLVPVRTQRSPDGYDVFLHLVFDFGIWYELSKQSSQYYLYEDGPGDSHPVSYGKDVYRAIYLVIRDNVRRLHIVLQCLNAALEVVFALHQYDQLLKEQKNAVCQVADTLFISV